MHRLPAQEGLEGMRQREKMNEVMGETSWKSLDGFIVESGIDHQNTPLNLSQLDGNSSIYKPNSNQLVVLTESQR